MNNSHISLAMGKVAMLAILFLLSLSFNPVLGQSSGQSNSQAASGLESVGETGQVTLQSSAENAWQEVRLHRHYDNPVVVVGPPSYNGSPAGVIRVRNVRSNSFEVQMQAWDGQDQAGRVIHESAGYMVMEAGTWMLENGTRLQAGIIHEVNLGGKVQKLKGFASRPMVMTQCMSAAGSRAVTTRLHKVGLSSFEVFLQEKEAGRKFHENEMVGFIAVETGVARGATGVGRFEVGLVPEVDGTAARVKFAGGRYYANSAIIAQFQTSNTIGAIEVRKHNQQGGTVDFLAQAADNLTQASGIAWEQLGYIVLNRHGMLHAFSEENAHLVDGAGGRSLDDFMDQGAERTASLAETSVVHPNAATNSLGVNYVMSEDGLVHAKLMDTDGRKVREFMIETGAGQGHFTMQTDGLPAGKYTLHLHRGQEEDVKQVLLE